MREMGLLENTWIIFTTDHGDMMGDHHIGAKSVFLEGSAHIPLLIRPPFGSWEIHPLTGKKHDGLVNLADILPTVLGIAEIEAPEDIDGQNLLSLAEKPDDSRIFYGNCKNEYFAVIEREYKYLWTALGGTELMFNLKEDPKEQKNLAHREEEQKRLAAFRGKLLEHLKAHNSPLVEDGQLVSKEAPRGPEDVPKWPGFHSTVFPSDVLH